MGYMFNKQLRGYNTEEVDDTIETLEKKIQETTLQIRRLEKEKNLIRSRWSWSCSCISTGKMVT